MNKRNFLSQRWRKLSITTKFTLASGVLLSLIVLVTLTGYIALTVVRRQTEDAILTSMEIQRLVLQMDVDLQHARLLERDFFLRWPLVGFDIAQETYAQGHRKRIDELVALGTRLRDLLPTSDVNKPLAVGNVNLNFYLYAADEYADTFDKAVKLVDELDTSQTGVQARIGDYSALLAETLSLANDPELISLDQEMQSFEKDYLVTRQRSFMQSDFDVARSLRQAINQSPGFEPRQQAQALSHLDNYLAAANDVLALDLEIRSRLNQFDLQVSALDPLSGELLALANEEVQQARQQIATTSRLATMLLVGAMGAAVALAGLIAWAQHRAITANIVKLTEVAVELQDGNLEARAEIDSGDEIGQLAYSFNAMATQLDALIGNLEQNVKERTQELSGALEDLKTTQDQLVEAEKMAALGGLVAGVAHEINTPVGVGVTAASVLEDKTTAFLDIYNSGQMKRSDLEKYLDMAGQSSSMILRNLSRAAELIQSFKQVAVDQSTEERRKFAVKPYLEEILLSLRPKLKKTQHSIEIKGKDDITLESYPGVFSQIVTNLVMNSLVHAYEADDEGHLTFELKRDDSRLTFEYADDGKGIPEENLSKIFDPFFTTNRGQGGSGLGLHIIYNLVTQRLGGTIHCQSEVGAGTRFVIDLPVT